MVDFGGFEAYFWSRDPFKNARNSVPIQMDRVSARKLLWETKKYTFLGLGVGGPFFEAQCAQIILTFTAGPAVKTSTLLRDNTF